MLIQVSGKGFELSSDLRYEIEERMETALKKFGARIRRVNVFLADENGPKHGVDKTIRAVINVRRLPSIVVEEKGEAWYSILDRTVDRAVHTVSRQVARIRTKLGRTSMAVATSEGGET